MIRVIINGTPTGDVLVNGCKVDWVPTMQGLTYEMETAEQLHIMVLSSEDVGKEKWFAQELLFYFIGLFGLLSPKRKPRQSLICNYQLTSPLINKKDETFMINFLAPTVGGAVAQVEASQYYQEQNNVYQSQNPTGKNKGYPRGYKAFRRIGALIRLLIVAGVILLLVL